MINRLFPVLVLFVFVGCSNSQLVEWEQRSLTEEALEICRSADCPEMTVNYLVAQGDPSVSASINTYLQDFVIESLDMREDGAERADDILEAMYGFAMAQQEFKEAFPDASSADIYRAQIDITLYGESPEVVSMELQRYLFTGGAHGYGGTEFVNFDPKDGSILDLEDLVNDMSGFLATAEALFRSERGIDQNASLNEAGFWFDQDRFRLPNTVGVGADGLLFVYNPYDIASYADGTIELFLPIDSIEVYLNSDLL